MMRGLPTRCGRPLPYTGASRERYNRLADSGTLLASRSRAAAYLRGAPVSRRDWVTATLALAVALCSALPLLLNPEPALVSRLVDVLLLGVGMGVVWALLRRHPIG